MTKRQQELENGNSETQENENEIVNDAEIKKITLGEGRQKPIFEGLVNAKVERCELVRAQGIDTDKQGNEYERMFLRIFCDVGEEQTHIDTVDNYGGLRYYPKEDAYWLGDTSRMGKLMAVATASVLKRPDVWDLIEFLNTGPTVTLKTESSFFQGKETKHNVIQAFV